MNSLESLQKIANGLMFLFAFTALYALLTPGVPAGGSLIAFCIAFGVSYMIDAHGDIA